MGLMVHLLEMGGRKAGVERAEKIVPEGQEGDGGEQKGVGRSLGGCGGWVGVPIQAGAESLGRVQKGEAAGCLTLLCRNRVTLSGG